LAFPGWFDVVREQLKTLGYPTEAVAHPSIGAEPPNKDLSHDTAHLRVAIEKLADEGKKSSLLHIHMVVSLDLVPWRISVRPKKECRKKGGAIHLVYLSAFALPKGFSLLDALGGNPLPWMNFKV